MQKIVKINFEISMGKILSNKTGEKLTLLGNEGIVRGAIESGVDFVSTYPGTPASEIGNVFWQIKEEIKKINPNFHFEFSTNEKVAMEAAAGAAISGFKSLVAMKNFGLNVASDFLCTLMYSGIDGSMVIFVADDPSCWSSAQSEQNTRFYSLMAHIPTLEPSSPQEFKDFTKFAFELSQKFKIPVMIRSTTRASHQSGPVTLGEIPNSKFQIPKFVKDPRRFSTMPPRVLEMKRELFEKIEEIKREAEKSNLNEIIFGKSKEKVGIVTSGVSFLYVMEALKKLTPHQNNGGGLPVLKLGFVYPLPERKILKFLRNLKRVLVVEELEPYLEREIAILVKRENLKVEILGKGEKIEGGRIWKERKAILPQIGELKPEYVEIAISKILNKKPSFNYQLHLKKFEKIKVPARPPILCPGCPYWAVINAIKKVVDPQKVIFGGEIGCYMLFSHKVINLQDYLYCMGSSTSVAHGISKMIPHQKNGGGQKVICFVGDSSFFHAGIPALINTVFNQSNPLIIILENRTTAMTGHQPHPGVGDGKAINIEDIVKACGIRNVKVVDQVENQREFEETIKEFLEKDEVSVIIARHICVLLEKKKKS
jgi:indolepyruvate ferredoxin oxidoreductase alpha subunit